MQAKPERFVSIVQFWPDYLAAHCKPVDRFFHFLGTTWLVSWVGAGLIATPWTLLPALLVVAVLAGYAAIRIEPHRPALPETLAIFAIATLGAPWHLPIAILGAYGLAWIGHFVIEKNRPAALSYPV